MKNILVMGGTQFVGRTIVEHLLKIPGIELTLFNRGRTNTDLFPKIKRIVGDRNDPKDLEKIFSHYWDVVIDVSGYMPDSLKHIAARIKTAHYIFISTISVYDYDRYEDGFISEEFPMLDCSLEQRVDTTMQTYGKRKAACENELTTSNLSYTILRPSIIFGPYDHTDRLFYWYYRIARQLEFIAPQTEEQISITYMADFMTAILKVLEKDPTNTAYNAATHLIKLKEIIHDLGALLHTEPNMHRISMEVFRELDLRPWMDLPYFVNTSSHRISDEKLVSEYGISFTPLKLALKNTIPFFRYLDRKPKYGLDLGKEAELIHRL